MRLWKPEGDLWGWHLTQRYLSFHYTDSPPTSWGLRIERRSSGLAAKHLYLLNHLTLLLPLSPLQSFNPPHPHNTRVFHFQKILPQLMQLRLVILALESPRQEDSHDFEAIIGYIGNSKPGFLQSKTLFQTTAEQKISFLPCQGEHYLPGALPFSQSALTVTSHPQGTSRDEQCWDWNYFSKVFVVGDRCRRRSTS